MNCSIRRRRIFSWLLSADYQQIDDTYESEILVKYWIYYQNLLAFGGNSSHERAEVLSAEFDQVFSSKTGYPALDERIAKSKDKKSELLMVLKYPELPLHNNDAELGARAQVRKRDVSLHTMTEDGTKANDTAKHF